MVEFPGAYHGIHACGAHTAAHSGGMAMKGKFARFRTVSTAPFLTLSIIAYTKFSAMPKAFRLFQPLAGFRSFSSLRFDAFLMPFAYEIRLPIWIVRDTDAMW